MSDSRAWAEEKQENGEWTRLDTTAANAIDLLKSLLNGLPPKKDLRVHEGKTVLEVWAHDPFNLIEQKEIQAQILDKKRAKTRKSKKKPKKT